MVINKVGFWEVTRTFLLFFLQVLYLLRRCMYMYLKAAKYEIQNPSTCRAILFHCKFWVDVSCFSPCVVNLLCNKNICCRLKKSRVQVYFEQQILALLFVFHQTHNLSHNRFVHVARQVEDFCILYFAA